MSLGSKSHKFNPLSVAYQQDPYESLKYLRDQPALYVEELGTWWVGRFEDVKQIASTPAFLSHEKFHEISLGEFDYAPEARSLVTSDPPDHTRLRALASPAFRPGRVRALMERVRAIANAKLDPLLAREDHIFDFQQDFAELVPMEMVASFMNTDLTYAADFRRWSHTLMSASQRNSMNAAQKDGIRQAIREAREYFLGLIAARRRAPGEDFISDMIRAQEGGEPLTDGEILSLTILLLNGGNSSSAHLLGNTMVCLLNHPDQFELLRKEPERLADVVDEVLRFESPVQTAFMSTKQDVSVGGTWIPADSNIIVHWGSANRDEGHFSEPERFDITRKKTNHMAFGVGPHFCIGNILGRQGVLTDLEQVLERMPNLKRAESGPILYTPSYWLRGPKTLPVSWE